MVSRIFPPDVRSCWYLFWNSSSQQEALPASCLEGIMVAFTLLNLGRQRCLRVSLFIMQIKCFHQGSTVYSHQCSVFQSRALWFRILLEVGEVCCLVLEVETWTSHCPCTDIPAGFCNSCYLHFLRIPRILGSKWLASHLYHAVVDLILLLPVKSSSVNPSASCSHILFGSGL